MYMCVCATIRMLLNNNYFCVTHIHIYYDMYVLKGKSVEFTDSGGGGEYILLNFVLKFCFILPEMSQVPLKNEK